MAITLQLSTADGALLSESLVTLDDELADYFSVLEGLPLLKSLRTQEPVRLDKVRREELKYEVAELMELAGRREGPPPPDWVGLDGTGDIRLGEEFGWRGLLDFLRRLDHQLHLCRTMELEMWVMPEE